MTKENKTNKNHFNSEALEILKNITETKQNEMEQISKMCSKLPTLKIKSEIEKLPTSNFENVNEELLPQESKVPYIPVSDTVKILKRLNLLEEEINNRLNHLEELIKKLNTTLDSKRIEDE